MTPDEKAQVRNETIDELANWLDACIEQVDHSADVYKACKAMVNGLRGKKTPDTAALGTGLASDGAVVTHYPLNQRTGVNYRKA
jgi:hypothetical protein